MPFLGCTINCKVKLLIFETRRKLYREQARAGIVVLSESLYNGKENSDKNLVLNKIQ